ncbi:hypothetical protein XENTR_v10003142 [Xenopus tropicalis]|nr:hypothetical protein XENTR_v10003142 [Xenopus tropicalis]
MLSKSFRLHPFFLLRFRVNPFSPGCPNETVPSVAHTKLLRRWQPPLLTVASVPSLSNRYQVQRVRATGS